MSLSEASNSATYNPPILGYVAMTFPSLTTKPRSLLNLTSQPVSHILLTLCSGLVTGATWKVEVTFPLLPFNLIATSPMFGIRWPLAATKCRLFWLPADGLTVRVDTSSAFTTCSPAPESSAGLMTTFFGATAMISCSVISSSRHLIASRSMLDDVNAAFAWYAQHVHRPHGDLSEQPAIVE